MSKQVHITEDTLRKIIQESVEEVMAQNQVQTTDMSNPQKTQGMPLKEQMQKLIQLNKTLNLALKQANELGLTDARNHIGLGIGIVEAEFAKIKTGQAVNKVKGWFNGL